MKVVIDHVSGSRRGQRQELVGAEVVTFGRHPGCDVRFDAHRDIDASSRHAELRLGPEGARLVDIGSSNGTYVGGALVDEQVIAVRSAVVVEFGNGGPQVAIWVGQDDDAAPSPPELPRQSSSRRLIWGIALVALLAIVAAVVIQLSR